MPAKPSNQFDNSRVNYLQQKYRQGSVMNLVLVGIFASLLMAFGTYIYFTSSNKSALDEPLTGKAFKGTFVKEVLDQGEIQSSENVEIRCAIKSRYGSKGATVQELIEEGKLVKGGDLLVLLRSDEIEAAFEDQTIARNNAKDALTAAENDLDSANATKEEYVKGLFEEEKSLKENAISLAKEELDKAIEYLQYSEKMQAKGFLTKTVLRNDQAAVDRAKRTWDSAKQSLLVLKKYTFVKNTSEYDSQINTAKSKRDAAEANLAIEEKQLDEIKEQLSACEIRVPENQSGQVVYANIFSRRGNAEFVLEEGAAVREGQVLIKLPNPEKMQVRATVNESRVTSIKEGMDVRIGIDALNGRELNGVVTKVNQYAEPEGWGGGGVRKYGVYIEIENPLKELRPGMNASVTIETQRNTDALMIPIQAVYGYRGKTFCLVKKADSWITTEIEVGSNNDTNMVVTKGLDENDVVALNPAGFKELLKLPDLPEVDQDSKDKTGTKPKRGKTGGPPKGKPNGKPKKQDGKRPNGKPGEDKTSKADSGKEAKPVKRTATGDDRKSGTSGETA